MAEANVLPSTGSSPAGAMAATNAASTTTETAASSSTDAPIPTLVTPTPQIKPPETTVENSPTTPKETPVKKKPVPSPPTAKSELGDDSAVGAPTGAGEGNSAANPISLDDDSNDEDETDKSQKTATKTAENSQNQIEKPNTAIMAAAAPPTNQNQQSPKEVVNMSASAEAEEEKEENEEEEESDSDVGSVDAMLPPIQPQQASLAAAAQTEMASSHTISAVARLKAAKTAEFLDMTKKKGSSQPKATTATTKVGGSTLLSDIFGGGTTTSVNSVAAALTKKKEQTMTCNSARGTATAASLSSNAGKGTLLRDVFADKTKNPLGAKAVESSMKSAASSIQSRKDQIAAAAPEPVVASPAKVSTATIPASPITTAAPPPFAAAPALGFFNSENVQTHYSSLAGESYRNTAAKTTAATPKNVAALSPAAPQCAMPISTAAHATDIYNNHYYQQQHNEAAAAYVSAHNDALAATCLTAQQQRQQHEHQAAAAAATAWGDPYMNMHSYASTAQTHNPLPYIPPQNYNSYLTAYPQQQTHYTTNAASYMPITTNTAEDSIATMTHNVIARAEAVANVDASVQHQWADHPAEQQVQQQFLLQQQQQEQLVLQKQQQINAVEQQLQQQLLQKDYERLQQQQQSAVIAGQQDNQPRVLLQPRTVQQRAQKQQSAGVVRAGSLVIPKTGKAERQQQPRHTEVAKGYVGYAGTVANDTNITASADQQQQQQGSFYHKMMKAAADAKAASDASEAQKVQSIEVAKVGVKRKQPHSIPEKAVTIIEDDVVDCEKEIIEPTVKSLGFYPDILTVKFANNYEKEDIAYMPVAFAFNMEDEESEKAAKEASKYYEDERAVAIGKKRRKDVKSKPKPKKAGRKSLGSAEGKKGRHKMKYATECPAEGLPSGWILKTVPRKNGGNKRADPYWFSPKTHKRFRSKKEVERFMCALDKVDGDEDKAWDLFKS